MINAPDLAKMLKDEDYFYDVLANDLNAYLENGGSIEEYKPTIMMQFTDNNGVKQEVEMIVIGYDNPNKYYEENHVHHTVLLPEYEFTKMQDSYREQVAHNHKLYLSKEE